MSSLVNIFSMRNLLLATASLGFSVPAWTQSDDLGMEAIIAPHFSKGFGNESRSSYGLDFYRVSSGASLLALYGKGAGYSSLDLSLRLSNFKQLFGEPFSRGLIYGLGLGTSYSPGVAKEVTATAEKAPFLDLSLNPYVRYLFDINGWVGPYLELGYKATLYRVAISKENKPLKPEQEAQAGSFFIALGFAFEAER